jgi:hypothetical protein
MSGFLSFVPPTSPKPVLPETQEPKKWPFLYNIWAVLELGGRAAQSTRDKGRP